MTTLRHSDDEAVTESLKNGQNPSRALSCFPEHRMHNVTVEDCDMPVTKTKNTTKKTRARSTTHRITPEFKALRHFAECEHEAFLRRSGGARLMDLATFGAEADQMRLIRALVKPLLVVRFDYPYPETGINMRGGRTHALLIQRPRDTWPIDSIEKALVRRVTSAAEPTAEPTDEAPFFVACEAKTWEGLYAAVEAKSRERDWWARAIGQRQAVYDWVYERRFLLTGDDEDALDLAIGAADMPLLDLDYFAQWCAAAPEEVRDHPVALRVLKTLAGDDVKGYLAERAPLLRKGRLVSQ